MQSSWPDPWETRLTRSSFCEVQGKHMARYGGVLPYAWSAHGQPLLLLGREQYGKNWSGSRRWSPFGGGVDPGETPARAALREGYEETMGLFGTPAELARRVDRKAWKHKGGVTLLLPVDHDPSLPRYFRNMYKYAPVPQQGVSRGMVRENARAWTLFGHQLDLPNLGIAPVPPALLASGARVAGGLHSSCLPRLRRTLWTPPTTVCSGPQLGADGHRAAQGAGSRMSGGSESG